ncbi:MAG: NAD(P)-dependent oxidoreductase [Alphaproteobacteria bacterium]|nr:NAD(P)-dependent oxidoreductase [Alphaproteobacteria bacterium]
MTRIAFLGLGKMGLPMASRLVQASHDVVGFDPVEMPRAAFAQVGGKVARTAQQAAEDAAVLITMLPDGKAVRAAVLDIVDRLAPDAIIIDMSSSAPLGTRALAEALQKKGIAMIDAPVSGGVKRAIDGSLAIMAGGDAQAIEKVRPLLETMGKSIFATGAVGSGHAMKALNNYVSAAGLVAACEALRIGAMFGLDPALMTDILNVSTGRNNSTEVKLKPFVIPKSYTSGFSLGLMAKNLRTADDLARALGVPARFSHVTAALWEEAQEALGAQADHTAIDVFLGNPEPPADRDRNLVE